MAGAFTCATFVLPAWFLQKNTSSPRHAPPRRHGRQQPAFFVVVEIKALYGLKNSLGFHITIVGESNSPRQVSPPKLSVS
jgi:hypothetical protein